jgi:hypothetical protein
MFKFCTLTGEINGREIKYDIETETIWLRNNHYKDNRWEIKKVCNRKDGYLLILIGDKNYYVHRVIYKLYHPEWDIYDNSRENRIDHENRNRADNRIINLRNVTEQENQFNRNNTKGYYWNKQRNRWIAQIQVNRKHIYLGRFNNEEDARKAYLDGKKIYHVINSRD